MATVAGSGAGDGVSGPVDGDAADATFNHPQGIAVDTLTGAILVAEHAGNRIRRVSSVCTPMRAAAADGSPDAAEAAAAIAELGASDSAPPPARVVELALAFSSSGSVAVAAAAALELATRDKDGAAACLAAGADIALVALLRSCAVHDSTAAVSSALRAVYNLAVDNSAAATTLLDAGMAPVLVALGLGAPTAVRESSEFFSAAVAWLSVRADGADAFAAAGMAPVIVRLANSAPNVLLVANAIENLAAHDAGRAALVTAGAAPALVALMARAQANASDPVPARKTAAALSNLAFSAAGRAACHTAGAAPALTALLWRVGASPLENAARAFQRLSADAAGADACVSAGARAALWWYRTSAGANATAAADDAMRLLGPSMASRIFVGAWVLSVAALGANNVREVSAIIARQPSRGRVVLAAGWLLLWFVGVFPIVWAVGMSSIILATNIILFAARFPCWLLDSLFVPLYWWLGPQRKLCAAAIASSGVDAGVDAATSAFASFAFAPLPDAALLPRAVLTVAFWDIPSLAWAAVGGVISLLWRSVGAAPAAVLGAARAMAAHPIVAAAAVAALGAAVYFGGPPTRRFAAALAEEVRGRPDGGCGPLCTHDHREDSKHPGACLLCARSIHTHNRNSRHPRCPDGRSSRWRMPAPTWVLLLRLGLRLLQACLGLASAAATAATAAAAPATDVLAPVVAIAARPARALLARLCPQPPPAAGAPPPRVGVEPTLPA